MTDTIEIYRARSLVPGRSGWRWETWAPIPGWEGLADILAWLGEPVEVKP